MEKKNKKYILSWKKLNFYLQRDPQTLLQLIFEQDLGLPTPLRMLNNDHLKQFTDLAQV